MGECIIARRLTCDGDAVFSVTGEGWLSDPAPLPQYREWVPAYWNALHPRSAGGAYVNFLMEEGEERIAGSYSDNYRRLAAIKAKYDSDNLFHVNQNIKPEA